MGVDASGRKWFVAEYSGEVCSFDGKEWETYSSWQEALPHVVGEPGVARRIGRSIAIDTSGRKWLATRDGMACWDGQSWQAYGKEQRWPAGGVRAVTVERGGVLWFATSKSVWSFYGTILAAHMGADGLTRGSVIAIAIGPDDRVWVLVYPPGSQQFELCCFDGRAWRRHTHDDICDDVVGAKSLAVDGQGRVWVGMWGDVCCFDGWTWRKHPVEDGGVNAIVTDPAGRIWFGAREGLSCLDGQEWRTWTTDDLLTDGEIQCLAVDVDGSIWVGTTTGVSHIVLTPEE